MLILKGKDHELGGGLKVRRVLPQIARRNVGPFVFFDHMGPLAIPAGRNVDVRPHPHIGLSTLTYLFKGRIMHRDSLGSQAAITPGEVNWMTAGKGISHSERAHDDDRDKPRELHGLQFWVALPDEKEDCEPSFQHYERDGIPVDDSPERTLTLIAGDAFGMRSPVTTTSPLLFCEIKAKRDFAFEIPARAGVELGAYVIDGGVEAGGESLGAFQMAFFSQGEAGTMRVSAGAHFVLLGGEPIATPRHIWWNLVSSSKEKIEDAKRLWREGRFPMVPGETEFIPLPD